MRFSRSRPSLSLALLAALAPAAAETGRDEVILTIPQLTVQEILDRASPLEGRTPEGLRYSIKSPRVTIRGGRILTSMSIALKGGINLMGQDLSMSLEGTVDGELVARVDARTRTIRGGLEIRSLRIRNLEELSDTQELKDFLNENLTRFEYPLDIPSTEIPELGMLMGGTITGIEIREGEVLIRSRLTGTKSGGS